MLQTCQLYSVGCPSAWKLLGAFNLWQCLTCWQIYVSYVSIATSMLHKHPWLQWNTQLFVIHTSLCVLTKEDCLLCRGVVKTALLLEGEGSTVIQDPMRTSYLEVYTDVGTADASNGTTAITNLSQQGSAGVTAAIFAWGKNGASGHCKPVMVFWSLVAFADASPPALTIRVLSPIRKGKDKKGFDAILGSRGMHRLRLGINADTGRLYVKRRIGHRL